MCVLKQTYKYEKIVLNFENLDHIIIPFEYIEQFSFERIVQKNHVSPTNETLCYYILESLNLVLKKFTSCNILMI